MCPPSHILQAQRSRRMLHGYMIFIVEMCAEDSLDWSQGQHLEPQTQTYVMVLENFLDDLRDTAVIIIAKFVKILEEGKTS